MIPKKTHIEADFIITKQVLGVGVNGQVLACIHKITKETFALKVYLDIVENFNIK